MKRLCAVCLLFIFSMNLLEAHQLVKLPAFIHHFQEHKVSNKSLTIWEFLDLHYANPSKDTPDSDHGKLPFKSHNCHHVSMAMEMMNSQSMSSHTMSLSFKASALVNHYRFDQGKAIWQPPQINA